MALPFYKVIVSSISLLIALYAKKYEEIDAGKVFTENPTDLLLPVVKEYDFIVVGAGSAGSVVVNRLSEHFTVLLLEEGGDPIPQSYIPSNFAYLIRDSSVSYQWDSVKQKSSCLNQDGIAKIGAGKFLGGTSVVNGVMYNRGNPLDYDNWAKLTGDDSWSYANVLQYFKMSEDFYEDENPDGHLGVGGAIGIRRGGQDAKTEYDAFLAAGKELGYDTLVNSNGPQKEGFGPLSGNLRAGRRVSTYDAFIKPILDRKTLTISRYSHVTQLDINEEKRAVGVYYTRHGVLSYAKAKREVILSAGAMNSPLILLRSGIGPADDLKAAGISVKADLPVGMNFQDHPTSFLQGRFDDISKAPYADIEPKDVDNFLNHGKGPLTLAWGMYAQAFITSSVAKAEGQPNWPDLHIIIRQDSPFHFPEGNNSMEIFAILGRVTSRGSLRLNPKDVNGPAIWDPQWLSSERDSKVIAEGVKIIDQLFGTSSIRGLGVTLEKPVIPGCSGKEYGSPEYWECHIRHITRTTWHPTSTAKMGKKEDSTTVVDSQLKVHRISGLRVIDNSIQPTITNANTNAPAIMIGQKGSAMILSEHKV